MQNGETWGHNPDEADFNSFAEDKVPYPDEEREGFGLTPQKVLDAQADYNAAFDEADDMEAEREVDDMNEMRLDEDEAKVKKANAVDVAVGKADKMVKTKPVEAMSFKDAFYDARKNGLTTFAWPPGSKNPKDQYTTELAGTKDTKPANPKKAQPVTEELVADDPAIPPRATFPKQAEKQVAQKGALEFGPKLNPAMQPRKGAPSIYDKRQPVRQAGSGLEERIPV